MICFMDRTFCDKPSCDCEYEKWTPELTTRAEIWWNPKGEPDKVGKAPVCFIFHEEDSNKL